MPIRRRSDLPDDLRSALALRKGERVLATAELVGGGWAVGTDSRLLVVETGARTRMDRGWYEVDTATWDAADDALTVFFVTGDAARLTLEEGSEMRLPKLVRERVESSVVARQEVQVRGRDVGRLVVRRVEGRLVLQTVLDRGTDPSDPQVAGAIREARVQVADMVGGLEVP